MGYVVHIDFKKKKVIRKSKSKDTSSTGAEKNMLKRGVLLLDFIRDNYEDK